MATCSRVLVPKVVRLAPDNPPDSFGAHFRPEPYLLRLVPTVILISQDLGFVRPWISPLLLGNPAPSLRLRHLSCLNSRHLSCLNTGHLSCLSSRRLSCLNSRHQHQHSSLSISMQRQQSGCIVGFDSRKVTFRTHRIPLHRIAVQF